MAAFTNDFSTLHTVILSPPYEDGLYVICLLTTRSTLQKCASKLQLATPISVQKEKYSGHFGGQVDRWPDPLEGVHTPAGTAIAARFR